MITVNQFVRSSHPEIILHVFQHKPTPKSLPTRLDILTNAEAIFHVYKVSDKMEGNKIPAHAEMQMWLTLSLKRISKLHYIFFQINVMIQLLAGAEFSTAMFLTSHLISNPSI